MLLFYCITERQNAQETLILQKVCKTNLESDDDYLIGKVGKFCLTVFLCIFTQNCVCFLRQAGGSTGLLMDLAANEKAVHSDFFNGKMFIFTGLNILFR